MIDRLDRGEASETDLIEFLSGIFGNPLSANEARTIWYSVFKPNKALWAECAALAGQYALGIFSNNMSQVSETFPAQPCFDHQFYSSHIGILKPDRRAFEFVQSALSMSPENILFIDDSAANIAQARAMGWHVGHYQPEQTIQGFLGAI